jgi:hypothetical protein
MQEATKMKANKSVLSALLGVALLAVPLTASAHEDIRNRAPVPAYHKVVVAPKTNFTPRVADNHQMWMKPKGPAVRLPERHDERWDHRDDYRPAPRYVAPVAPYNPYVNSYRPGYYAEPYNYSPNYYGAPVGGGLANLIRQRDNAQVLYHQAVANGNHERAKHLLNDIISLNKEIARARA